MGKVQVFDAIPPIVVCFPCEISIVSSLYYSTTNDLSDRFSKKFNIYFTNNDTIHKRSRYNKVNVGCSTTQKLYTGSVNIHNESVFQLELHMLYCKSGDVTHTHPLFRHVY